jgi:hypothetical protein
MQEVCGFGTAFTGRLLARRWAVSLAAPAGSKLANLAPQQLREHELESHEFEMGEQEFGEGAISSRTIAASSNIPNSGLATRSSQMPLPLGFQGIGDS